MQIVLQRWMYIWYTVHWAHTADLTPNESPPDFTMPIVYAIDPFVGPTASDSNGALDVKETKDTSEDIDNDADNILMRVKLLLQILTTVSMLLQKTLLILITLPNPIGAVAARSRQ